MRFGRVIVKHLALISVVVLYTSCKSTAKSDDADVKGRGFDQTKVPSDAKKIAVCNASAGWDKGVPGSSLTMYDAVKYGHHQIWAFGATKGEGGLNEQFSFVGTVASGWTGDGLFSISFTQAGGIMEFAKAGVPAKKVAGVTFFTKPTQREDWDGSKMVKYTIPQNSIDFSWDTGGLESVAGSAPELSPWWQKGVHATCQTFPTSTELQQIIKK